MLRAPLAQVCESVQASSCPGRASAFSAILIYAIDLVPHRIGLVGGLFYGLSFGLGGVAAAALGGLADQIGIIQVFKLCAWLPALGLLTFLLPKGGKRV